MINRKRVLVIDDEDMIREIIKTVLTEAGYQVAGAANGAEGLKLLESQPVDLIITDILMPEKEGIETIIETRKSHPNIKIVAISGGGRAHNFHPLKIASKIGADMTLPKPFEPDELLAVVKKVFDDIDDRVLPANSVSQ
jgi:DNA-binding response OmpR family regulator